MGLSGGMLLSEAAEGGWGISGTRFEQEQFEALAGGPPRASPQAVAIIHHSAATPKLRLVALDLSLGLSNKCGLEHVPGPAMKNSFASAFALLLAAACSKGGSGPVAPSNTAPNPQTHTWFLIASGPHAVSCNSCHGSVDTFKQFDCLSCHAHDQGSTDRIHASIGPGYSYSSQACYS